MRDIRAEQLTKGRALARRLHIPLVVYVAGPFRAPDAWGQTQNVRLAEEAALEVWRRGMFAVCPHTMTQHYQGACPDDVWLAGLLEVMRRCDAVLVVGNWVDSEGTKAEIIEARRLGMDVVYSIEDL